MFWNGSEPSNTGKQYVGAGPMKYHQIPTAGQGFKYIPLNMITGSFARQQVARPSIVPFGGKSIADDAGKFAGD